MQLFAAAALIVTCACSTALECQSEEGIVNVTLGSPITLECVCSNVKPGGEDLKWNKTRFGGAPVPMCTCNTTSCTNHTAGIQCALNDTDLLLTIHAMDYLDAGVYACSNKNSVNVTAVEPVDVNGVLMRVGFGAVGCVVLVLIILAILWAVRRSKQYDVDQEAGFEAVPYDERRNGHLLQ